MLPPDIDEADASYISSFPSVPEDAIVEGILVCIPFIDPESGATHIKTYYTMTSVAEVVGYLELMKHEILNAAIPDAEGD